MKEEALEDDLFTTFYGLFQTPKDENPKKKEDPSLHAISHAFMTGYLAGKRDKHHERTAVDQALAAGIVDPDTLLNIYLKDQGCETCK